MAKTVHRPAIGPYRPAITADRRVYPLIVDIAIEDLRPTAARGESELITKLRVVAEIGGDDYITAYPFDPAMKGDHSIFIVDVEDADRITANRRLHPAQTDEILRETQKIDHRLIAGIHAMPVNSVRAARIVVPLFIFQEFLAHEDLRDSRRE